MVPGNVKNVYLKWEVPWWNHTKKKKKKIAVNFTKQKFLIQFIFFFLCVAQETNLSCVMTQDVVNEFFWKLSIINLQKRLSISRKKKKKTQKKI